MDPRLGELPDYCDNPTCPDTNWGGQKRKHLLSANCPAYVEAKLRLKLKLNQEFQDAYFSLPHLDKLGGIQYHDSSEKVSMSLESFKTLASFFVEAHYAVRKPDGEIYELPGLPYKVARDLAEMGGAQLMQKFETGWFEA